MAVFQMCMEAAVMSGPMPSPSMNGMIGWSGTIRLPSGFAVMRSPSTGRIF